MEVTPSVLATGGPSAVGVAVDGVTISVVSVGSSGTVDVVLMDGDVVASVTAVLGA